MFFNERRGQSSVADALFFFTIASALALFLFVFGTNYGSNLASQTEKEQFKEYTSSAFKTILYLSTPRNPAQFLDDVQPNDEVDFLLAAAKEDFADDGDFNDTAETMKSTIRAIMQPLANSADYAFFIRISDPKFAGNEIPYFVFYKSEFLKGPNDPDRSLCPSGLAFDQGCHNFYYCRPNSQLETNQFFFSIPGISRASAKTRFLAASTIPGSSPGQVDSEVHFAVWPSTPFPTKPANPNDPPVPFQGLKCCKPEKTPDHESDCYKQQFKSVSNIGSGTVLFSVEPRQVDFSKEEIGTTQKEIHFIVKNTYDKQVTINSIVTADPNNNCFTTGWITPSAFSGLVEETKLITAAQLKAMTPNDPLLSQGYYVQGEDPGNDETFDSANLGNVQRIYNNSPDNYQVMLFHKNLLPAKVLVPTGPGAPTTTFQICSFKLNFLVQGDANPHELLARPDLDITIKRE